MQDMTDEEYDALDELLTKTTPKLTDIPGVFARERASLKKLDNATADYISANAEARNKALT